MDHYLHRDNNRSFLSEAASWLFISLWPGEEVGTGWGAGGKSTSKEAKGEILEWPLFLFHFSLVVGEYQWSVSISIRSTDLMPQAWALLLLSTRWRSSFIVYSFEILPYYVSNSLKKKKKKHWHTLWYINPTPLSILSIYPPKIGNLCPLKTLYNSEKAEYW